MNILSLCCGIPKSDASRTCHQISYPASVNWLEKEQGYLVYGADYSFPTLPFSRSRSLVILSSRMLRACLAAMKEGTLPKLSVSLPKQGMIFGGRFLMRQTLESHNIEREYSFSELLENEVSEKYFLSEKMKERILNYKDNRQIPLQGDTTDLKQQERTLLNVNSMHNSISYQIVSLIIR